MSKHKTACRPRPNGSLDEMPVIPFAYTHYNPPYPRKE